MQLIQQEIETITVENQAPSDAILYNLISWLTSLHTLIKEHSKCK